MEKTSLKEILFSILSIALVLLSPVFFLIVHILDFTLTLLRSCRPKRIEGEIAVVTGGGNGLGRCIALELAKHGCHIAVADISLSGAEETVQLIRKSYAVKANAYQVDVSSLVQIQHLNEIIKSDMGLATILVNNAGIILFKNPSSPEPAEIERLISVNLTSHFWTNSVFLENMRTQRKGHIVAISSISGIIPLMSFPHYSTSKFGVRALMRCLRLDLKTSKLGFIKTTTVYPYFIKTNSQIRDAIENLQVGSMYPSMTGEEVARRTVNGVLCKKEEVFVPGFFAILYRLSDCLPSSLQDLFMRIAMRTFESSFREIYGSPHVQ